MPSAFRNWKTLPQWLQLDYFKRRRDLGRWKMHLVWGMLLGVATLAAAAWLVPGSPRWLQAAPVSDAHAFFNSECARCHTDAFQTARRFINPSARSISNDACKACHDAPDHTVDLQYVDLDCAACHREHRGRKTLARVPDSDCTFCHANLPANSKNGDTCRFQSVTGFPTGHPEFALWRGDDPVAPDGKDPGRLKFNHKVHLDPLQVFDTPGKALECVACHQVDSAGRYMQPIDYEGHCARCHVLSVQLTGTFDDPKLQEAGAAFDAIPAPHPQPDETSSVVRAALLDRLLRFVQQHPVVAGDETAPRPFPKPPSPQGFSDQEWRYAEGQLGPMERQFFFNAQVPQAQRTLKLPGGCAKCHIEKQPGDPRALGALPEYEPTRIRNRWLPHSRFRHDAHRMLLCTECHKMQGNGDEPARAVHESTLTSDVLMPRVAQCAECHNPRVGTRWDCAECHRYHRREHGYDQEKEWTIEKALKGR